MSKLKHDFPRNGRGYKKKILIYNFAQTSSSILFGVNPIFPQSQILKCFRLKNSKICLNSTQIWLTSQNLYKHKYFWKQKQYPKLHVLESTFSDFQDVFSESPNNDAERVVWYRWWQTIHCPSQKYWPMSKIRKILP